MNETKVYYSVLNEEEIIAFDDNLDNNSPEIIDGIIDAPLKNEPEIIDMPEENVIISKPTEEETDPNRVSIVGMYGEDLTAKTYVTNPAIAIPLSGVFIPKIPKIIANIPHPIDNSHIQKNTNAIIPNTKDAIQNPFLLFSSFFCFVSVSFSTFSAFSSLISILS